MEKYFLSKKICASKKRYRNKMSVAVSDGSVRDKFSLTPFVGKNMKSQFDS